MDLAQDEPALDPTRPIIDPHLHCWDIRAMPGAAQEPQRFLLPEAAETIARSGHAVTHTVFVECHQMYRSGGPPALRSLGESEFANGIAAMSASDGYGPARVAHRIVGSADLRLGAAVRPVLEAHLRAAGERFAGIRMNTAYSQGSLFGQAPDPALQGMLCTQPFQAGARVLAELGLTLDVWNLGAQLDDVIALANAVPGLAIILDHVGTPEVAGRRAAPGSEAYAWWERVLRRLAERPNVRVKLGGLGMALDQPIKARPGCGRSSELAEAWRRPIETCIDAFTPARAMFESNFPPDRAAGSYAAVWNAFKIIAAGYTRGEQDALFRGTAAATYRIALGASDAP